MKCPSCGGNLYAEGYEPDELSCLMCARSFIVRWQPVSMGARMLPVDLTSEVAARGAAGQEAA
jgi:hypothetical protein